MDEGIRYHKSELAKKIFFHFEYSVEKVVGSKGSQETGTKTLNKI